ncbi:uncharacterized protein sh2d7 [Salvelinus fontinalis]|uniref:uncharacterized protein sh2d7 n=1 Tax=Salvelinus fontinalis TaxID=8038 RepID=UPI0024863224|nr:uncharacterized protein sh2d7 [Salvelinus fontinalis]
MESTTEGGGGGGRGGGGGGLRELVRKWFTETQAPLILLHDGNFPGWFQGFTARKEAEDQLREKPLGCFLIRLSDKAVGYILSYKGQDRCRHFVINQDQAGLFIISGDDRPHHSLTELIEHYRVHPIQPFGESLTSTYCCQSSSGELYDVVQFEAKEKTGGISVRALRSYWDQQNKQKNDQHQQNEQHPAVPPVLPPKTNNRKLTSTVSIRRKSLPQQAVPPVPRRGPPLTHSLSGTLSDKSTSQIQYAEIHHDQTKTTSHGQTQYAEIHHDQTKTTSHGQTQYAEIHHDQTKTTSHGQTQYAEIHHDQTKTTSHGQTQYAEIHHDQTKITSHGQTQYAEIHHDQTKIPSHGQTQYAEIHHDQTKIPSHGQTQYAEIHHDQTKITSHGQIQYAEIHHDQTKITSHGQTQYAEIHTNQNKVERLASTGSLNQRRSTGPWSFNNTSTAAGGVMYSELTLADGRSRSLPRLDDTTEEEEEKEEEEGYSNRTTIPCFPHTSHSPNPPKRVTCHAYSLQDPRENPRPRIHGGPHSLDQLSTNPLYQASVGLGESQDTPWKGPHSLDQLSTNPLYQASVGLGESQDTPWKGPQKQREWDRGRSPNPQNQTPQQEESMYAEVPEGPSPPRHLITDNTYEQIPGDGGPKGTQSTATDQEGNTYEQIPGVGGPKGTQSTATDQEGNTYEQIPGNGGLKGTQSTATDQEGNTYEMLEDLKSKESTWGKKVKNY